MPGNGWEYESREGNYNEEADTQDKARAGDALSFDREECDAWG